jgi:signal peptidase I
MVLNKLSAQTFARFDSNRTKGRSHWVRHSILLLILPPFVFEGCQKKELTAIVHGGSMAPSYVGEHFQVQCADCGFRFVVGVVEAAGSTKVVCPNCGFDNNELSRASRHVSPVFEVLPAAQSLQRWEVAAFRFQGEPAGKSRLGMKRIAGLPNEIIRIADGEIWIGNQIARKNLQQQMSMSIPVFDSEFLPGKIGPVPHRLRFEPVSGNCQQANNVFQMRVSEQGDPGRLSYTHWAGYRHAGDRFQATPIKDDYAYNPSENRSLNDIHEILVHFKLTMIEGDMEVSIDLADPKITVALNSQEEIIRVTCGDYLDTKIPWTILPGPFELTVSNIDDQVIVAIDGAIVVKAECETRLRKEETAMFSPVSVQLNCGQIVISRIQIARDLYYFDFIKGGDSPSNGTLSHEYSLGNNEYLLLGDHVPQSADSRSWAKAGVPRSSIFGLVPRPVEFPR